jgi:hypothetical protein
MPARWTITGMIAGAALLSCLGFAGANAAEASRHIRGTVTGYQNRELTVEKTRGGPETVKLVDGSGIFLVKKSDLASIKPDQFVGITSVEESGKRVAREVHVFAEDLRGLGEGHYPWDLDGGPNMMTNANIAKVQNVGGDRVLKLNYSGGEQTISVPNDAAVVLFEKTSADQLVAGRKVFILMKPQAEGNTAAAVVVGADGLKPPM